MILYKLKRQILCVFCIGQLSNSHAFLQPSKPFSNSRNTYIFAGGGFGSDTAKGKSKRKGLAKSATSNKKKIQIKEKLLKSYGGDIAKGTEQRIKDAISALPPHVQETSELYKKIKRWDASMDNMSVMQKSQIPQRDLEGAKRAKAELEMLYQKYDLSEDSMHNIFQQITWDASADAKAIKATIGEMPPQIMQRVDRACGVIADCVKRTGRKDGKCLDVGCGHGTLVPAFTNAGIYPSQICGVDLSPEMIRNAEERYRGPKFYAQDFLQFDETNTFDGIIFCSALHDLPDMKGSLTKAARLLRPEGKIVILHCQGGGHVLAQHKANPVLVNRGLPDGNELSTWAEEMGLQVEVSPAAPASKEDKEEGYFAILS